MTLMSSISKLTGSVDQLAAEANVTKAELDAKVALAEAEIALAQAEQTTTEIARDEATTHAADAATHLATVKADVTYEGIGAILAAKAVDAVDVFIYDTSLDSDGGAWRKRCHHTSWYNEPLNTATRGARREFPAVAVIVSFFNGGFCQLRIYDGDDPALPLWREFNNEPLWDAEISKSSTGFTVFALNGLLAMGHKLPDNPSFSGNGMALINFPSDQVSLLTRNMSGTYSGIYPAKPRPHSGDVPSIVSFLINDLAMTVLPDAPIEPTTGLPVPTIAVATDGGLNVIKDDGIVLGGGTGIAINEVEFFSDEGMIVLLGDYILPLLREDWDAPDFNIFTNMYRHGLDVSGVGGAAFGVGGKTTLDHYSGFSSHFVKTVMDDQPQKRLFHGALGRMTALLNSSFNAGYMVGDIKGAFLADTDNTDLVGSGELVTNGDFATNDLTGFVDQSVGSGSVDTSSGAAVVSSIDNSNFGKFSQSIPVIIGARYIATFTVSGTMAFVSGNVGISANFNLGTYSQTFVANASPSTLSFQVAGNSGTTTVDNISVKLADADRSVANRGLIVNGTITRSPVAEGAELVGYSGFSYTNYLEQPYNSALDFGTGDFCYMGWLSDFDNWRTVVWRGTDTATSFVIDPAGTTSDARINLGGSQFMTLCPHWTNEWRHMAVLRSSGVVSIYVNGILQSSFAAANNNLSLSDATLGFGEQSAISGSGIYSQGQLALWRISATAPTPDQIAKIYADEKRLFQPGAKCTLYGTSDAVTALAHDPKTNLLHVGTSQGRSVFDGLLRVANTETPVTTAISAVNGMIAEQ